MNAKTTAMLLLATGVLTSAAYADNPPDSPASTPTAVTRSSVIGDAAKPGSVYQPTVSEVILSDYRYGYSGHGGIDRAQAVLPKESRKADRFSLVPVNRRFVFGITPSPIIRSDPSGPAEYFPSVAFRFDFGRGRHS